VPNDYEMAEQAQLELSVVLGQQPTKLTKEQHSCDLCVQGTEDVERWR